MTSALKRAGVLALNLVAFPLSGLMPRSPRQWVFGDVSGTFAGNPKFFFLWLSIHQPQLRLTWITKHRATRDTIRANGYRAHTRSSLGGIWAVLRAKVYVYGHSVAHINAQLCKGALYLNLWHGVGLKAVGYEYKGAGRGPRKEKPTWFDHVRRRHRQIQLTALVTTSDFMQDHFSREFRIPRERCPQLGYSRLDWAFDLQLAAAARAIEEGGGFQIKPDGFDELAIYMPTFRDSRRPFLQEALPDLARLSAALRERGTLLYLKPHPKTPVEDLSEFDNIRMWPEAVDINTYLADFDVMITDYSSVLYDYLLVKDTGALLYTFDMEEYLSTDRNLSYPFEENVAGLRVDTFAQLCHALTEGSAQDPSIIPDVLRLRRKFWGGSAQPASPAIYRYMQERYLADTTRPEPNYVPHTGPVKAD